MKGARIVGEAKLRAHLLRIAAQVEAAATPAMLASAEVVASRARARAPVDTGALRNSIRARVDAPGRAVAEAVVPYARFQEFGTVYVPAVRYLREAIEPTSGIVGPAIPVFRAALH